MDEVNQILVLIEEDHFIPFNINIVPALYDLALPLPIENVHLDLYDVRGERKPHNESFYETTIPLYSVCDFKSHFRMSRHSMDILTQIVAPRLQAINKIAIEKKVMFTVWALAKPETFLACGDRFDMSSSSAQYVFEKVVGAISELVDEYIMWPTLNRQLQIAEEFKKKSEGFPGIVGAIDGTHIYIERPSGNANDYYDRYQRHSVILQAICDDKLRFINITTGYPGRMHDARVFRVSAIGQELIEDHAVKIPHPDQHLIGDSAYGLAPYMQTPFRDNGHLTARQVNFNKKLSSVRSTIERSFGRLKGKFRRLKLLELKNLELISKTVVASCVLHNMILDIDGHSDEDYSGDEDEDENEEDEGTNAGVHWRAGEAKRNSIVAHLT